MPPSATVYVGAPNDTVTVTVGTVAGGRGRCVGRDAGSLRMSVMVIVAVSGVPLVTSLGGVPRVMMTVSPSSAVPSSVALSVNMAVVVLASTVTLSARRM